MPGIDGYGGLRRLRDSEDFTPVLVLSARDQKVEKIVSKEAIILSVARWDDDLSLNAIEVYVSRLRAKLEPAGVRIRTVRGFGYMLEEFRSAN